MKASFNMKILLLFCLVSTGALVLAKPLGTFDVVQPTGYSDTVGDVVASGSDLSKPAEVDVEVDGAHEDAQSDEEDQVPEDEDSNQNEDADDMDIDADEASEDSDEDSIEVIILNKSHKFLIF